MTTKNFDTISVRKNLIALIFKDGGIQFRTSRYGDLLKSIPADKACDVITDLAAYNAKSVLAKAFEVETYDSHTSWIKAPVLAA